MRCIDSALGEEYDMIAGMTFYEIFAYFLVYSFIGWVVEVAYHAVTLGRVVNRGFLNGPVCPVYGVGMVLVFAVIDLAAGTSVGGIGQANAGIVFLAGMILASTVEFIGGWGLYHIFHARWWDYRKKPFNLGGYVCLEFSIYWGLGALLVTRVLHPVVDRFSAGLVPEKWGWPLMAVLYLVYFADAVVTVLIVLGLNKRLAELDRLQASMRIVSDDLSERIGTRTLESMQRLDEGRVQAALARAELRDAVEERREETEKELALRKAEAEARNEQLRESAAAFVEDVRTAAEASARARAEENRRRRREMEERAAQLRAAIRKHRVFGARRLMKAFPALSWEKETYDEIMKDLREEIYGEDRRKE